MMDGWTEPSMRQVSSTQVGLVVGKESNMQMTHPVADLAPTVAGSWWTRFSQMHFASNSRVVVLRSLVLQTCTWITSPDVTFRKYLYHLYRSPGCREPQWNCPKNVNLGMHVSSTRMTYPHHRSRAVCRNASMPLILQT